MPPNVPPRSRGAVESYVAGSPPAFHSHAPAVLSASGIAGLVLDSARGCYEGLEPPSLIAYMGIFDRSTSRDRSTYTGLRKAPSAHLGREEGSQRKTGAEADVDEASLLIFDDGLTPGYGDKQTVFAEACGVEAGGL